MAYYDNNDYDSNLNADSASVVGNAMSSVERINAATQKGLSLPAACRDCKNSISEIGSHPSSSMSPQR